MRVVPTMAAIDARMWDACANPDPKTYDPFLSHTFLAALEESGSAVPETGWGPQHVLIDDPNRHYSAVMPMYLKGHSQGEYVFDHAWADAYHRAGGHYYPKLLVAVPFTPVTGRRLLVHPEADRARSEEILTAGMLTLARERSLSSVHVNFVLPSEGERLRDRNFLLRTDQQFHWLNENYESFDAFLANLSSRKRKQIKRERDGALEAGITIRWLTGSDLKESHWDAFFAFYTDTGNRKWGRPYLTRSFFSLIGERMADRILLILCERAGKPIAGALNFIGGSCLFGRYWGALEDHRFLHFETCYYQAIDFAIMHKLARVEAGAQGGHKLARGYMPTTTMSAHWIAEPPFRDAVARYLESERTAVQREIEDISTYAPYRRDRPFPRSTPED